MALGDSVGVLGLNGEFFEDFFEFLSEFVDGDDFAVFFAVLFAKGLLHEHGALVLNRQEFLSHAQKMNELGWGLSLCVEFLLY